MAHDFIAENKIDSARGQLAPDIATPFKMPRHQHQKQIRELRAQAQEYVSEDRLFPGMRAAAQENAVAWTDPDLAQHGRDVQEVAFVQSGGIEFQAANHMNRF